MQRNAETVGEALTHVQELLDAGKPGEAVELARKLGTGAWEVSNAYGVALMRAGDIAKALDFYRGQCIGGGGVCLKQNLPPILLANFATAMLLANNVSGGLALLRELDPRQQPYVGKLQAAIQRWRRSLNWWKRFSFDWYGADPKVPIRLDFPPGEIPPPRELRPAA